MDNNSYKEIQKSSAGKEYEVNVLSEKEAIELNLLTAEDVSGSICLSPAENCSTSREQESLTLSATGGTYNFICSSQGENSSASCENYNGMPPNNKVEINGINSLSNIIKFNDGGYVLEISLRKSSGAIYEYVLYVYARGPKGAFSGNGYLHFQDKSGDTYNLKIYDSSLKLHTLSYNSDSPNLCKIVWNN